MRGTVILLAAACLGLLGVSGRSGDGAGGAKPVVVVELFTSEGCSSCPPADALVKRLVETQSVPGVRLVGLEFHVDYWDELGWKDPYSSAAATARQQGYVQAMKLASMYTPQAVVMGQWEGVGSDERQVRGAIAAAVAQAAPVTAVSVGEVAGGKAEVKVGVPDGVAGEVVVVVSEGGLSSEVRRGENAGKHLALGPVVREVVRAGAAAGGEVKTTVAIDPTWKRENLQVVALVSEPRTGKVLSAGASPVK